MFFPLVWGIKTRNMKKILCFPPLFSPPLRKFDFTQITFYMQSFSLGFDLAQNFLDSEKMVRIASSNNHCVKSVCIPSFSGPYFLYLDWIRRFTKSPYSLRKRENTDQKNFEYGHFSRREYSKAISAIP